MIDLGSAEKVFRDEDQDRFASVSGDRNPMHMDAVVARRTMAGFRVVHGVDTLLWSLDGLFEDRSCVGAFFHRCHIREDGVSRRLPRLATDQTATLTARAEVDTMSVLRPILEDMYAAIAL